MPVLNVRDLVEAERGGQTWFSTWRKAPAQVTVVNVWFDLSMSPGNPVPNYYIGPANTFTHLRLSTDGGLYHGSNVAPAQKFLRTFGMMTPTAAATPLPVFLLDYIGFYPFVDESVTDVQVFDNTNAPLRWGGRGVQMMPVVVAPHSGAGGITFYVNYTNQDGVTGRRTPQHILSSVTVNGTILSSGGVVANSRAPFMALQPGDTGVLRADSIVFEGTGDIGLIALVLVKPLAKHYVRAIDAPTEADLFVNGSDMPLIPDDAYINLICCPTGSITGAQLHGYLKTCWI